MRSTDRKAVAAECGKGGIRCTCCGDAPHSRARKRTFRRARRRERNQDLQERLADYQERCD